LKNVRLGWLSVRRLSAAATFGRYWQPDIAVIHSVSKVTPFVSTILLAIGGMP
jgi:hypothetical protein